LKVKDMTEILSGQDLIDAGMPQGKWFAKALAAANAVLESGGSQGDALEAARAFAPPPALPLHAAASMPLHRTSRLKRLTKPPMSKPSRAA
jgi:hypothetical protein